MANNGVNAGRNKFKRMEQKAKASEILTKTLDGGVKVKTMVPASESNAAPQQAAPRAPNTLNTPNTTSAPNTPILRAGSLPFPKKTLDQIGTITELRRQNFADDKTFFRAQFMDVTVACILSDIISYIEREISTEAVKTPAIVTCSVSTQAEDTKLKRVSSSHREGRAFDLRSVVFSPSGRAKLMKYVTESYGHFGAISTSTGMRNVILHKNSGYGWHFHVQFDKNFLVEGLVGKDLDALFLEAQKKPLPVSHVLASNPRPRYNSFGKRIS